MPLRRFNVEEQDSWRKTARSSAAALLAENSRDETGNRDFSSNAVALPTIFTLRGLTRSCMFANRLFCFARRAFATIIEGKPVKAPRVKKIKDPNAPVKVKVVKEPKVAKEPKKAKVAKDPAAPKAPRKVALYTVSPILSAVIGDATTARTEVIKKIWEYIKSKNLQVLSSVYSTPV